MKTTTKEVAVFISEDNKEFLDQALCEKYEKEELGCWKDIRYFSVVHSADLTEGRGWSRITYMAVEGSYSSALYAELYCEKTFGSSVEFVQGVAPTHAWNLQEIDRATFDLKNPGSIGDYPRQVATVFLSNGKALEGLPEPIPLRTK